MDNEKQIVENLKKIAKSAQSVSDSLELLVKELREQKQILNRMRVEKQLTDEREYTKDL